MAPETHRYFIINKPRDMVSQFVSTHAVRLLGDLDFSFPEGIHAIGRLDNDSEGLLILTTNKKITNLLFNSAKKHRRRYLVMVRHAVSEASLRQLREGIVIRVKGGGEYTTQVCDAVIIDDPSLYIKSWDDSISYPPFTWLLVTLTEGKFHQVRKMVSAVHHRCIRLIRLSIESLALGDLQPGEVREIPEVDFFNMLDLERA